MTNSLSITKNILIDGDALSPQSSDMIAQVGRLDAGAPVPDGWTVMDGNMHSSAVGRVIMRWQVEPACIINLNRVWNEMRENTAGNRHTENVVLIAEAFAPDFLDDAKQIKADHDVVGSLSLTLRDTRDSLLEAILADISSGEIRDMIQELI